MNYEQWRIDVFGQAPDHDPVMVELLTETYKMPREELFDYIDRALIDPEIHMLFSKDQIGIGLNLIYSNSCSDFPFCYIDTTDESRKVVGIRNLKYLYLNYFERHCTAPVKDIGNNLDDGEIGVLCYMFWDAFVLYPGNASPLMTDAAIDVMDTALNTTSDNCIVSAIHGLGHWGRHVSEALHVLEQWLRSPTSHNQAIQNYAKQATTGRIQ